MNSEPIIRFSAFFGVLLAMALWEAIAPCRQLSVSKPVRWLSNLGIVVLNTAILRLVFPMAAVGVAAIATERSWGLLNVANIPYWQAVVLSVIVLDGVIYLQHVMFHALPTLWRLHKVHHADIDFDVTTGLRFHPLEILLSMGIKMAAILLLGAPVLGVLIFEVLLNATAMFNHGNVTLPQQLDRVLRLFVVTPDMHRVHHSVVPQETNSNFGFNLPWWDYLFGTYRDRPAASQQTMTIGLSEYQRNLRVEQLHWMLLLPFLGTPSRYAINRDETT
ncbi:sterol desaturase family protein [Geitlerinema sp. PCC 9228]|jgi:sterol desaturase/sphingolipid hydroxylase (fatty acid hydroxylase superfamily)|uniref:sterol desaturase family protein n=1 Tax=Geitlerinema sp. PCC 9228 TaxID=111611 RepID=UPI0008F9C9A2|nr:sterol desaturase family protein [Geitlerinema sp. PCC 9228]